MSSVDFVGGTSSNSILVLLRFLTSSTCPPWMEQWPTSCLLGATIILEYFSLITLSVLTM